MWTTWFFSAISVENPVDNVENLYSIHFFQMTLLTVAVENFHKSLSRGFLKKDDIRRFAQTDQKQVFFTTYQREDSSCSRASYPCENFTSLSASAQSPSARVRRSSEREDAPDIYNFTAYSLIFIGFRADAISNCVLPLAS